jgi:acyl-CoA thioesterase I
MKKVFWTCRNSITRVIVAVTFAFFTCNLCGVAAETQSETSSKARAGSLKILAFGDSITAGYHLDRRLAFPALLEQMLKADGLPAEVINAGISGDTTAQGVQRIGWILKHHPKIDVVLLELGANDGLRALPLTSMKANLHKIIAEFKKAGARQIVLFGMKVTKNLSDRYREDFEKTFPTVAAEERVHYLPFFLEKVAFHPELTLEDLIHPNEKGHQALAEALHAFLKTKKVLTEIRSN